MDYSGAGSGQKMNPSEKAALMNNLKQQVSVEQAKALLEVMSEKCFKICIQKPGSSLSGSDQVNKENYNF
jgi:import inner membrane translocase subunit TIM13